MMANEEQSEPLPILYRPAKFDEIVGNESAVKSVISLLEKPIEKISHSWMFTGESGCGKTTFARIVTAEMGCDLMDFKEYNASDDRGIGFIRGLKEKISLYPRNGDIKIYLLDEAHMLTKEAQNALLKLLEDPPSFVYIFLATTNPEKLIRPIHSRCTTIKVTPVSSKKMVPFIKEILFEEIGEEAESFDQEVIKAIADNSFGACRDALKLLDMIIDMDDYDDMLDVIEQGVPQEGDLKDLCELLKTPRSQWPAYTAFLKDFTGEAESLRKGVLNWFGNMLTTDGNARTAEVMECFEKNYYDTGKAGLIMSCFQAFLVK
jgi:DNA polymerase III gamma/tau subunit